MKKKIIVMMKTEKKITLKLHLKIQNRNLKGITLI